MRGRPVIQWLVFTAAWLLLLIPVARVTSSTTATVAPAQPEIPTPATRTEMVWLSVRFSTDPASFTISKDDAVIWSEPAPSGRFFERAIALATSGDQLEFHIAAALPEAETAIEVAVETDAQPRRTRTLWLTGDANDPVTFPWSTTP